MALVEAMLEMSSSIIRSMTIEEELFRSRAHRASRFTSLIPLLLLLSIGLVACPGGSKASRKDALTCSDWDTGASALATAQLKQLMTSGAEVAVFLKDDITPRMRRTIEAEIKRLPGVASVFFQSKQDAYNRFRLIFAAQPDIVNNTSPDAMPASFRVSVAADGILARIESSIRRLAGVQQVRDERTAIPDFLKGDVAARFIARVKTLPSIRTADGRTLVRPNGCTG